MPTQPTPQIDDPAAVHEQNNIVNCSALQLSHGISASALGIRVVDGVGEAGCMVMLPAHTQKATTWNRSTSTRGTLYYWEARHMVHVFFIREPTKERPHRTLTEIRYPYSNMYGWIPDEGLYRMMHDAPLPEQIRRLRQEHCA